MFELIKNKIIRDKLNKLENAINETQKNLNKELSYSKPLKHEKQISFYRNYLVKLMTMQIQIQLNYSIETRTKHTRLPKRKKIYNNLDKLCDKE